MVRIDDVVQARGAATPAELTESRIGLQMALERGDVRRARDAFTALTGAGIPVSAAYLGALRPALAHALEALAPRDRAARERLLLGAAESMVADALARMPGTAPGEAGRCGVVADPRSGLVSLDARMLTGTLERDGWAVSIVDAYAEEAAPDHLAEGIGRLGADVLVVPTAPDPALMNAARVCAQVRRLPAAPLIVGCGVTADDDGRRAETLGVDAFVVGADALLELLARRVPRNAERRWGVRLHRDGDALVIAPEGLLDESGTRRLRQIIDSRAGSFGELVLDLRRLEHIDRVALRSVVDQPGLPAARVLEA